MYGTCHNKVTVLRPCNGYGYGRSTGTGTGVARVRVRASHGYGYGRSTAIGSYVRAYCRYSYGRMTDTALIGVAYVRSCDLYAFIVEFRTKARTCERPFPHSSSNQLYIDQSIRGE